MFKKRQHSFPTSWNELTQKQLKAVWRYFLSQWEELFEVKEVEGKKVVSIRDEVLWWKMQHHLYFALSGLKLKQFNALVSDWEDESSRVEVFKDLRDSLAFLFEENALTENKFENLEIWKFGNGKRCVPHLLDCKTGEFVFADSYFLAHKGEEKMDEKGVLHIDKFIATLYRNEPFHMDYKIEPSLPWVSGIPIWKKEVIVRWWEGCRNKLPVLFPHLFGSSEGEGDGGGTWIDFHLNMSAGKFGDFRETGVENILVVLQQAENEMIAAKKQRLTT